MRDNGANHRASKRYPVVNFVWYKVIEDDPTKAGEAAEGISKMCDVSESGIGLVVTKPIPIGKKIFTEVITEKFSLSMVGEVVHSKIKKEGYYRLGIHFTVVPPNDRLLLSKKFGKGGGESR